MADFTLSLGDVDFADFEIPDSIKAGGGQALDIKKYGGGLRTIDTFGADDDPITWSGFFLDGTAEQRCQQLDAMRKAGAAVALSFGSFSYQVVISKFSWDYQKYYQIAYSIELQVVADNTQPITDNGDDTESDMQSDLDDASDYDDALDDGDFSDDMDTVQGDLSGMPSITGGTVPQIIQLGTDVATAQGRAGTLASEADTAMNTIGLPTNFAAGLSPSTLVDNLNSLSSTSQQAFNAFGASNTLTRLGNEIASIIGG